MLWKVRKSMENYEKELEINQKRNEKILIEFKKWLEDKELSPKTINKHISNMDLYLNDYLNYYEVTKMEDGIHMAHSFLNDWFIRKCLYSSKTSIKENSASIKKFYQCMSEKGYVSIEDYNDLAEMLKNCIDEFLDSLDEYENMDDDDFW